MVVVVVAARDGRLLVPRAGCPESQAGAVTDAHVEFGRLAECVCVCQHGTEDSNCFGASRMGWVIEAQKQRSLVTPCPQASRRMDSQQEPTHSNDPGQGGARRWLSGPIGEEDPRLGGVVDDGREGPSQALLRLLQASGAGRQASHGQGAGARRVGWVSG